MIGEFADGRVVVAGKNCQLPKQSVFGSSVQGLSLVHVIEFRLFGVVCHAILLLTDNHLQGLLFLEHLADHDERGCDEVGLRGETQLKHSLQKGKNSIDVFILFDRDKDEIEEELC